MEMTILNVVFHSFHVLILFIKKTGKNNSIHVVISISFGSSGVLCILTCLCNKLLSWMSENWMQI
jgi:hypothetical protein